MLGPHEDNDNFQHELRGVIPRSFEYLFKLVNKQKEIVSNSLYFYLWFSILSSFILYFFLCTLTVVEGLTQIVCWPVLFIKLKLSRRTAIAVAVLLVENIDFVLPVSETYESVFLEIMETARLVEVASKFSELTSFNWLSKCSCFTVDNMLLSYRKHRHYIIVETRWIPW